MSCCKQVACWTAVCWKEWRSEKPYSGNSDSTWMNRPGSDFFESVSCHMSKKSTIIPRRKRSLPKFRSTFLWKIGDNNLPTSCCVPLVVVGALAVVYCCQLPPGPRGSPALAGRTDELPPAGDVRPGSQACASDCRRRLPELQEPVDRS